MKVLVFTTLYPNNVWPEHGIFVKERMSWFAKLNGCQVKVVAPVPYYPPIRTGKRWRFSQVASREVIDDVEVYHPRYLMIPKVGMSLHGLMMFLSVLRFVKKIKRDFDFDIIDSHYVYPDGFAAVLLGRVLKKPVVVSARGTDINLFSRFPLILRLIRFTLMEAVQVISVCQALKDTMVDLDIPEHKITVIPNGVDVEKFRAISKTEARKKLNLPVEKKMLLSVGSLIPRKGFELLIAALEILVKRFGIKDVFLIIIGEGNFRGELEEMISQKQLLEYVELAGKKPHDELYQWYSAADVFCLMSNREGWPNVVMEALACGTPVVATNVWGIPEIIASEALGLLTPREETEIVKKLQEALQKKWRHATIQKYAKQNSWERTAKAVFEVLSAKSGKENADTLSP